SRWGLFLLALRTALGFSNPARDLQTMLVSAVEIRSRSSRIPVALDGEADVMSVPLRYRSRPAALRVLVPSEDAGTAADAARGSDRLRKWGMLERSDFAERLSPTAVR